MGGLMEAAQRTRANAKSFERMVRAEPVLQDLVPAGQAVPGMTANLILTSGPPMAWLDYTGGQRAAVLGAAQFEGLARDASEADTKLATGEIQVDGCHRHGCVGSLAGVYSASMPVFVVRNGEADNTGFCNLYEGTNPRRLNYGVYDQGVRERLLFVQNEIAPILRDAIRRSGGIPLKPIMKRALHMSDELH